MRRRIASINGIRSPRPTASTTGHWRDTTVIRDSAIFGSESPELVLRLFLGR